MLNFEDEPRSAYLGPIVTTYRISKLKIENEGDEICVSQEFSMAKVGKQFTMAM
jgi:hypothetical protein